MDEKLNKVNRKKELKDVVEIIKDIIHI